MKYIAYYRVSTQKQSLGLDAQRNSVSGFISSDSNNSLVAEYSEKESGKLDNRNELNKALAHCKKENATLVIAKLDRLSRKVSFIFALKDSGVEFIALDVPNFNTLTLGIFATIAQSERETISQRTKAALQAKKKHGYRLGNPNANFSLEQRKMAINAIKEKAYNNENSIRAKALIEVLLKEESSMTSIANILNDNGFKTAKGCLFTPVQVIRIIKRYNLDCPV